MANRRSSRVCSASVLAVADRRDEARLAGAAELLVQLPAGLAAADRRPVQLAEPELIDLARPDVGGLADEAPPQFLLHRDVPRPDVAAVELIGQREDGDRARHRDEPVAQVGIGNQRDAVGRAADERQRVRRVEQQVEHRRMVRAQRPGQRVRIVGDAEAGAQAPCPPMAR